MGKYSTDAIDLISQKRDNHLKKVGRTVLDDVRDNEDNQLLYAANALIMFTIEDHSEEEMQSCCPQDWDQEVWNKMIVEDKTEKLIIAGALLAGEIDRLLYLQK